ncbi:MAG: hypothetical protein AAB794_00510 [Patescibacteria group bacterium]
MILLSNTKSTRVWIIAILLFLAVPLSAEASWFNKATGVGRTLISNSSPSISNGLVGYWTFDGKDTSWTSATAGTTKDLTSNGKLIPIMRSYATVMLPSVATI